jgi:hypothetical protein
MELLIVMELECEREQSQVRVMELGQPACAVPSHVPGFEAKPSLLRLPHLSFPRVSIRPLKPVDSAIDQQQQEQAANWRRRKGIWNTSPNVSSVQAQTDFGNVHVTQRSRNAQSERSHPLPKQPQDTAERSGTRDLGLKLFLWKYFQTFRSPPPSTLINAYNTNNNTADGTPVATRIDDMELSQVPRLTPSTTQPAATGDGLNITSVIGSGHDLDNNRNGQLSNSEITLSLTAPQLYSPEKGVYVGHLNELDLPEPMLSQCHSMIRNQLSTDLIPVLRSLQLPQAETMIEPELVWSGYTTSKEGVVKLVPTLWIRCGSEKCQKAIVTAVKDLCYLRPYTVRVGLYAPRPAGASRETIQQIHEVIIDKDHSIDRTGLFDLPNVFSGRISGREAWWKHFKAEVQSIDKNNNSACGLRIRFRHISGAECISTIGGLVDVGGDWYALTTAHALAEIFYRTGNNPLRESDTMPHQSTHSITSIPPMSSEWLPVQILGACYGIQKIKELGTNTNQPTPTNITSSFDFALIKLNPLVPCKCNDYRESPISTSVITVNNTSSDLCPRAVRVLCSSQDVRLGYLTQSKSLFLDSVGTWETRKIRMDKNTPLRKFLQIVLGPRLC